MLYLIGIGLENEKDITVKGLEIVKKCQYIYFENYTSKLNCPLNNLEQLYEKKVIIADRKLVEESDEIVKKAVKEDVALLVIGDPLTATTHIELLMRAKKFGVDVKVVHNASILTAIGSTGLELYKFGRVASIPFENESVETPIKVLEENQKIGLHTLFLLDLKPEEDRFMECKEAIEYLLRKKGITEETKVIVCIKLGSDEQIIKYGEAKVLLNLDVKEFPQCLIIPGELHFVEAEFLENLRL